MKRLVLFIILSAIGAGPAPAQNSPRNAVWDTDVLDTARKSIFLSGTEKELILEVNKARSNPQRYAELYIRPRLNYFSGLRYSEPGQLAFSTKEGRKAVEECYSSLSQMSPAPILQYREGLLRAAADHSKDMSRNNVQGHTGSDGSDANTRAARYGRGLVVESTGYGLYPTVQEFVINWLIDDGVPSRSHQLTMMNKEFNYTGVSIAESLDYHYVYVLLFSYDFASFNHREELRESDARLAATMSARLDPDRLNWNIPSLDTAADVRYLSAIEKDIVLEINMFREDPYRYAELYLGAGTAGRNAITTSRMGPLFRFSLEEGLCRSAKDPNGDLGTRVRRYGVWLEGRIEESVARGFFKTGRDVVAQFLNGVNRDKLLSQDYLHIGVCVRTDPLYGLVALVIFAESYISH